MLALDRHPVCCVQYLHRRMAGEQIDHHADMCRIEMLDQDERHAGAGRKGGEQPPERIEATRRGAEPYDREALSCGWREALSRRMPARRGASRCSLSRTLSLHSNAGSSFGISQRRFSGTDMRYILPVSES